MTGVQTCALPIFEAWGRRRLAYPIGKQRRGVYVYVKYVGGGGLVAEVERNLKLQDAVMKFMTVQTSDEVDLAALTIDPEEAKLGKFELPPETEPEESREKQLGLIDLAALALVFPAQMALGQMSAVAMGGGIS